MSLRRGGPRRLLAGILLGAIFAPGGPSRAAFAADPQPAEADSAALSQRPELVTPEAEEAIQKGLAFLARTQANDGSWRADPQYHAAYPTAITALSCLALMAAGNTPHEGTYSANVRKAVDYLIKNSNSNGLIARMDEEQSCMHGHGFATLCLAEAYGMELGADRQLKIRRVLQKAVKLTTACQSAAGGWLYQPNNQGDEGSVTVTQIQALRACRNAGIKTPKAVIVKACKYIEMSANPDGGISYRVGQPGSHPPITAAAVATLYNAGEYEHPVALKALKYLKVIQKSGDPTQLTSGHEYYHLLYMSQAMYLSSDENWQEYFPGTRDRLIKSQAADGSWKGDEVGKAYGAATALLALQLPYGCLPILQR